MTETIINAAIWYLGAFCLFSIITAAMAGLALLMYVVSELSGKRLLRFIRFETVRYWVVRMEREGLTLPQVEYRRMVEERKPKTAAEFLEIDRIERDRIMDGHMSRRRDD